MVLTTRASGLGDGVRHHSLRPEVLPHVDNVHGATLEVDVERRVKGRMNTQSGISGFEGEE